MVHRVRLAMQYDLNGGNLGGESKWTIRSSAAKRGIRTNTNREEMQKRSRYIGNNSVVIGILKRRTDKRKASRVRATVALNRKAGGKELKDNLMVNHLET